MKLTIPNSAFLGNIEGFVRKLDLAEDGGFKVELHPRWISVHPFVLSAVAALSAYNKRKGVAASGCVPSHRSINYLARMKLFDHIGLHPNVQIVEHESAGRFIPVTQVRNSTELQNFITEMIPLLHAEPTESDPIKYVMSELVRNVIEHSDSPDGAFICAQYFKDTKRVAIGVADTGRGIFSHISQHHNVVGHKESIMLALKPGITGTTKKVGGTATNAGAGLFFTRNIAKASKNLFVIYSGSALYKLRKKNNEPRLVLYSDAARDNCSIREGMPSWPGTVIGIDIATERTQAFSALLKMIRDAYSVDVRQGRKAAYKKPKFI